MTFNLLNKSTTSAMLLPSMTSQSTSTPSIWGVSRSLTDDGQSIVRFSRIPTSSSWISRRRSTETTPSRETFFIEDGEAPGFLRSRAHFTKVDFPAREAPITARVIVGISGLISICYVSLARITNAFCFSRVDWIKKGITWSILGSACWSECVSSMIGMDEGWCILGHSGASSSDESRFVFAFCGRELWCRELWAAGGADLTRSLNRGLLPGFGDGEETECLEDCEASPYERVFDRLKSMISFYSCIMRLEFVKLGKECSLHTEPESGQATSRLTRLQRYRAEPLLVPCNAENCMWLRNICSNDNRPYSHKRWPR